MLSLEDQLDQLVTVAEVRKYYSASNFIRFARIGFSKYVTSTLDCMCSRPDLFGSTEAIEFQALSLLESEHHLLSSGDPNTKHIVNVQYLRSLKRYSPRCSNYLHTENREDFGEALKTVCQDTRKELAKLLKLSAHT